MRDSVLNELRHLTRLYLNDKLTHRVDNDPVI